MCKHAMLSIAVLCFPEGFYFHFMSLFHKHLLNVKAAAFKHTRDFTRDYLFLIQIKPFLGEQCFLFSSRGAEQEQLDLPASSTEAKGMLCCLCHFWIMMVKTLSADCFKVADSLPEPTSLFPRIRGIGMQ